MPGLLAFADSLKKVLLKMRRISEIKIPSPYPCVTLYRYATFLALLKNC